MDGVEEDELLEKVTIGFHPYYIERFWESFIRYLSSGRTMYIRKYDRLLSRFHRQNKRIPACKVYLKLCIVVL